MQSDFLPTSSIMEAFDKQPVFTKLSNTYLQRKFKLNHAVASIVIDIFNELNLAEKWYDVTKSPPKHKIDVIVRGKSFTSREDESFKTYVAYLDMRSGWVNSETHQSLYVTHWMHIPEQYAPVEDEKKTQNKEYYGPTKVKKPKVKIEKELD